VILHIVKDSEQLKKVCKKSDVFTDGVIKEKYKFMIEHMFQTSKHSGGVGLAAPQLGFDERIFIINYKNYDCVFINPKIESEFVETKSEYEKCLSVPDQRVKVERPTTITVQYANILNERVTTTLTGNIARIFQHELDHLNGVLITDYIPERKCLRCGAVNRTCKSCCSKKCFEELRGL